ncbi:Asp-tRNA(Asn)/Glu-tRNA(Gln) amidotransferase subunit GatC [Castellaniella sp.]|uniref:Asp-tRNA(Asn)/Glu-tRNA(Gln) amidotransferase subunit GatC n=1 Tax=Castellaniella sp. TaxID=1955812 RepID=UPI002AFE3933|nr:Asp-tRNA(Asn)/Glu-tRNA(Gln) amidotransferase subunit GatC [Castellaniella sp.]
MALTEQDIARLARLSGLQLDSTEQSRAQQELSRILDLIQELQAVDTSGIEPMAHPLAAHQAITLRLRDDAADPAQSTAQRDAYLKNAPAAHQGLFLVPTVIE